MADDNDIRKHGPITEFRPEKDDVSGGRDKSVQTEARGAEGATDLSNAGASSAGGAGRLTDTGEGEHNG